MKTRHVIFRLFGGISLVATTIMINVMIISIAACGQDPAFQVQEDGKMAPKSNSASGANGQNQDATAQNGSNTGSTNGSGSNAKGCVESCDLKRASFVVDGAEILPDGMEADNFVLLSLAQKQTAVGKLDVLWIVDSSGSMSEEQTYLGQNFSSFISGLAATPADFQTAVTTTDICQDQIPADLAERRCPVDAGGSAATHLRGGFVGTAGRKVLKKGDTDLVSKFRSYTNVGVNGSGFEHGLKAAQLAVQKSLSGENQALVRTDSFLSVIVVSDEEDDSIGMWMTDGSNGHNYHNEGITNFKFTDQDFIGYMNGAVGAGKYSVSAITGTREANGSLCTSAHSRPFEEGTQYIHAAQKTGGIVQSICEPDWSKVLTKIAQDLPGQITQLTLEGAVVPQTIRVLVNGQVSNDWTYVEASRAVKFNAGKVPPPGAAIQATYFARK